MVGTERFPTVQRNTSLAHVLLGGIQAQILFLALAGSRASYIDCSAQCELCRNFGRNRVMALIAPSLQLNSKIEPAAQIAICTIPYARAGTLKLLCPWKIPDPEGKLSTRTLHIAQLPAGLQQLDPLRNFSIACFDSTWMACEQKAKGCDHHRV